MRGDEGKHKCGRGRSQEWRKGEEEDWSKVEEDNGGIEERKGG